MFNSDQYIIVSWNDITIKVISRKEEFKIKMTSSVETPLLSELESSNPPNSQEYRSINRSGSEEDENREEYSSFYLLLELLFSTPPIIALFIVLPLTMKNKSCTHSPLFTWLLINGTRKLLSVMIGFKLNYLSQAFQTLRTAQSSLEEAVNNNELARIAHNLTKYSLFKKQLQNFGLLWLILGTFWLFSYQACPDSSNLLFITCLLLITWGYVIIFLPCLIICFGIPILLLLARYFPSLLNFGPVKRGATDQDLDKLKRVTFNSSNDNEPRNNDQNLTCSICLLKYKENDEMIEMPCKHCFHQVCVTSWLKLNATCPICRKSIINEDSRPKSTHEEVEEDREVTEADEAEENV